MEITNARYVLSLQGENESIRGIVDGKITVIPIDPANTDYAEILKQVKEGTLTIKDAE